MSTFDTPRPRLALEGCEPRAVPAGGPYSEALAALTAAQAELTEYVTDRSAAGRPADPAATAALVGTQDELVRLTAADAGRTADDPPADDLSALVGVGSDLAALLDRLVRTTDGPDCDGSLKEAFGNLTEADEGLTAGLNGQTAAGPADGRRQQDVATQVGTHAVLVGLVGEPFPDGCGAGSGGGSNSVGSEAEGRVRLTAVGAGLGGGPRVQVYDAAGGKRFDFFAFDPALRTGVRVATGDVNGDRVDDVVAVTGPGRRAEVRVFDGRTAAQVAAFPAFEDGFTGGGYAAVADLDGTGRGRVAVSAAELGGPRVTVFDGTTGAVTADFFALADDLAFRGGVRVTAGDLDADGAADLVATAGAGGGPRVARFSGAALRAGGGAVRMGGDFFAFDPALRNGATAAVAAVTGTPAASLVLGGGADGRRVTAAPGGPAALAFTAGTDGETDVRVGGCGEAAGLTIGFGPGTPSRVRMFTAADLAGTSPAPTGRDFVAFEPSFVGGVYVS